MARDRRLLVPALALIASVPIVVAAVHAVVVGWVPTGDRAYFAVRAFDVFSDRSPLVGPWSSGATAAVGQVVYSPGPMLYWLLAIPARFLDESLLQVTAGVVNVACIAGALVLARRRGGLPLLFATAIAVPIMIASLPQQTHADIWNSSAPLFPLLLLVFLCWSLACGEFRLAPLTAVVASFAVQTHLTFAAPVAGILLVAGAGLLTIRPFPRDAWRWIAAAAAVALVCWSFPLIDQITNSPGNLRLLVDAATSSEPTLGRSAGWHALVHAIGIVPWWLSDPRSGPERIADITTAPGFVSIASTLLLLAALGLTAANGLRRRCRDVTAAAALALALSLAVAVDAATTPRSAFITLDYTLRWGSPAGMCVWLLAGWSLLTLLGPLRLPVPGRRLAPLALAAAVVTTLVVTISVEPLAEPYDQMRALRDRLSETIPASGATRVDGTSFDALAFKAGAVYELRRAGKGVVATGAGQVLGDEYEPSRGYVRSLRIDTAPPGKLPPPAPGSRTLIRLLYPDRELRAGLLAR